MQVNRLFEMVYMLIEKKKVTAREFADYFEVSMRTIYRDVEVLSAAGIPIYTEKGKSGGICLLSNYVIQKSVLSENDQINVLSSLQGMKALNVPEVEPVLRKLAVLFEKNNADWIDVDFSNWGSGLEEQEKFNHLKNAILKYQRIRFDYYSSYGEATTRTIEPLKLLFKGQAWYLYGFCLSKAEDRFFKVSRIRNLEVLAEYFVRETSPQVDFELFKRTPQEFLLVLKIEASMAFRVYDEFDQQAIEKQADDSFIVSVRLPEDGWIEGYLLSYGDAVEVMEPLWLREQIRKKLVNSLKKYV